MKATIIKGIAGGVLLAVGIAVGRWVVVFLVVDFHGIHVLEFAFVVFRQQLDGACAISFLIEKQSESKKVSTLEASHVSVTEHSSSLRRGRNQGLSGADFYSLITETPN